jgi:DNA-binding MarR family transcriptional regulator
MAVNKSDRIAIDISIMAVRLIRWLRAVDEAPTLSGPEASALSVIIHSEGVSPSVLAELEQVRRPTITRVINRLIERGLIQRDAHLSDKRSTTLVVTNEGQRLWDAGQLRKIQPLKDRVEGLSANDMAVLEAALPVLSTITEPPR